jgi:hypothetical protein
MLGGGGPDARSHVARREVAHELVRAVERGGALGTRWHVGGMTATRTNEGENKGIKCSEPGQGTKVGCSWLYTMRRLRR